MSIDVRPVDLIREVKKRPSLYRSDLPLDRVEKLTMWREIGKALYLDWKQISKANTYDRVLYLQKKWRSLRDAYYREIRSRKRGIRVNKRVYIYFKKMTFLGGFEGEISEDSDNSLNGDNVTSELQSNRNESSLIKDPLKIGRADRKKFKQNNTKQVKRRKVTRESSTDSNPPPEQEMPMFQMEGTDENQTDSDKLFLLSFLPEMREFPPHIKMWVRVQIANVMQEAVNCNFNNSMPVGACLDRTLLDIKQQRRDSYE